MRTPSSTVSASAEPAHHVERISGPQDLVHFPDHLARYRFALQWAPASKVLDICCGVGYGSFLLAAGGAARVLGIDISEEAIAAARAQPPLPNLAFEIRNALEPYPDPGTWDFVSCFEGIEHVPDPKLLLSCVWGALKPGGVAVISSPNANAYAGGYSGNPFHISEMAEAEFRTLIDAFPWGVEWYAQIPAESIWKRPRWQQAIIRRLPGALRAWRQSRSQSVHADHAHLWKLASTGAPVPELASRLSDDFYPIHWNRAVAQMYQPPPGIIIAVCRRAAAPRLPA